MVERLRNIAESKWFGNFIIGVILLAGVVVGLETYPSNIAKFGAELHLLNDIILVIFVLEIIVKMGAEGSKPWNYFKDPWNVFDFAIVAVAFMPFDASYVTVLRLLRLLRVLKLVRAVPRLQVLVGALLHAIPSMFYVSILLFLLFYIYACAATFLFSGNDPVHFATLQLSMLSLFRVVTLEDWTDIMYINMYGCDEYGYGLSDGCTAPEAMPVGAALFFVSFVLLGTMIILNLFIGVIMTGMDQASEESARHAAQQKFLKTRTVEDELHALRVQMAEMTERLVLLHSLVSAGQPHESMGEAPVEPAEAEDEESG